MSLVEVAESLDGWAVERLETEITLVAAHLAAGECRWLQLVAEFDRREAWVSWGCASAAHWLNFRCGIDMGAARERVRVARRLAELPLVTAAFSVGELSYSKVRAVTRVATPPTEEMLVGLASCMTASQLERTVRCYRLAADAHADEDREEDDDEDELYRDRFLSTEWNDDGSLSIRAKLPPVEGEMVMAALRRAASILYRDRHSSRGGTAPEEDVSAETSDGTDDGPCGVSDVPADVSAEAPALADTFDTWGAQQADALVALAESVVADGLRPGSGPNRHTVVIHTTLKEFQDETIGAKGAYLEDGPLLRGETVRRLMCDSSLMFVLEGEDGAVINVSRRAPSVPSALARAVKLRDGGCVFPGCTRLAFVDLHHLVHRIDGGENTLANAATLCRVHHRLVHEGGFGMDSSAPGRFEFHRPDGVLIDAVPTTVCVGDDWIHEDNADHGIRPTEDTPVPDWDGRRPDYPHITDILLDLDDRLRDDPHHYN